MPDTAVIESTPAPSGSPAPVTSAPASAAPVASPSPSASQQPISEKGFKRALEAAAAKQDATTVSQPGSATTVPLTTPAPAGDPSIAKTQGPIPFDVHRTALDNARTKAVAEWRQRYGWAERIPQATIEQWAQQSREISTDPIAHYVNFGRFLQNHPVYGPQMKSHAGRVLAGGGDPMPQPDREIVDPSGNVIGRTFADGGVAFHEWSKRQMLSEVQRELNPIKEERARQSAQIEARAKAQRISQHADAVMEELHGILGSPTDPAQTNALFEAVHQVQAENPSWSWHKAALHVRKTRIEPTQQGRATEQAADLMRRKAAGNTANGASTSAATVARPRTEKDLARYLRENDRTSSR